MSLPIYEGTQNDKAASGNILRGVSTPVWTKQLKDKALSLLGTQLYCQNVSFTA